MTIVFNKLFLHNFGSYGDAELRLANKGFCLVSGENRYKKDKSLSNGSGKTNLWSAICYALTGETINGLRSNLKNINIEEDSCYVTLDFDVDGANYMLTRTHRPKSALKLIKDGVDISGKTFTESEKILADTLPSLTKDLIASTILLGQALPNKFSAFSPSGRKELLEKLTNSDYMIEDIRQRISQRSTVLDQQVRDVDDKLLVATTKVGTETAQLAQIEEELNTQADFDYEAAIQVELEQAEVIKEKLVKATETVQENEKALDGLNARLLGITGEKAEANKEELAGYSAKYNGLFETKTKLEVEKGVLLKEIATYEAITDVCPTCGQKISVYKPDTTQQRAKVAELEKELSTITAELEGVKQKHKQYLEEIDTKYDQQITDIKANITRLRTVFSTATTEQQQLTSQLNIKNSTIDKLKYDQAHSTKHYDDLRQKKAVLNVQIASYQKDIESLQLRKSGLMLHVETIKKIETLIKRDFRGYLLTNIIAFLDQKSKEYSELVFGTRELSVFLNGNALEITYCNKYFDNLSGGEKQRVDLILQFVIRDMLSKYLNFSSNIIVLDEVTDYLDKVSCDQIIKLITNKLSDVESVFIISHHSDELQLPIDSQITVVKDEDGISSVTMS